MVGRAGEMIVLSSIASIITIISPDITIRISRFERSSYMVLRPAPGSSPYSRESAFRAGPAPRANARILVVRTEDSPGAGREGRNRVIVDVLTRCDVGY